MDGKEGIKCENISANNILTKQQPNCGIAMSGANTRNVIQKGNGKQHQNASKINAVRLSY